MKIIERYILKHFISITFIALLVMLALFTFLSMVNQLDDLGKVDYTLLKVIQYVLLTVPRLAYELLPVAALVGSMATLGILSHSSELVVIRTSGISVKQIAYILAKCSIFIIIFSIVIGEFIAPYSENKAQQIRSIALTKQFAVKTKYGFWSREGESYINIEKILPDNQLEGVQIYEFENNHLKKSTYAKHAKFSGEQWYLEDIEHTEISDFEVKKNNIDKAVWTSLLSPDVINMITIEPQYLTVWGLKNYIDFLHVNDQNSQRYQQAFWSKIFSPLMILVMVMLAVPLVKSSARMTSVGQRVFIGCLVGIAFHLFIQIFSQAGIVYSLNPFITISSPIIILFIFIMIALGKYRYN